MADKIRVLYVDDEPGLLKIGKLYIERGGSFVVDTLTSAREALARLNTEMYDVIISDYQMPEIDGISFLKQLKALGNTTPFIIFTGKGREEVVIEAINEGADFYLQKGGEPKAQFAELSNKICYAVTRRRAEEALRQREHDFTSLVENATDLIVRFDTNLRYIYCNPAFERLLGIPLQQIRGRNPLEFDTSVEWNRFIEGSLRWTLEMGKEQEVELPVSTTSGLRYFLTRIIPERDLSGTIISLLAITRDITDRKLVEEALRESEEKFKTLFETATDALFMMDNRVFLDCNRSTMAIFRCSLDQIIGHSPVEFSPERQPDGRLSSEKVKEKIDAALSGEPQFFEWVHLHYDRTPFDAEVTFNSIRLGNIRYLQAVVRDVSTRKQAERALLASETFNRNLVENLPDYIIVHEPDGKILYANPASSRVLGYDADQFVGTPLLLHVAGDHRDDMVTRISGRSDGNEAPHIEIDLLSQDGGWRSVIVKGTPIQYQDNPAYLTLFVDITERKRAEEALDAANKKLTLLSSITRHDINYQLSILQGYLALLEQGQPDTAFSEYFLKISGAAQRISAMIRFTKEYEQIGNKDPDWQDCAKLAEIAAMEAPIENIVVNNDLPASLEVFADPLIIKVFYNLIDNAGRYGGKITTLRFSIEECDDGHIMVCEDDGDGIPDGEKEKIFERGFGKNTGVGLFLSREILAITGITISETGMPGKGARFEMKVPKGKWRTVRGENE